MKERSSSRGDLSAQVPVTADAVDVAVRRHLRNRYETKGNFPDSCLFVCLFTSGSICGCRGSVTNGI